MKTFDDRLRPVRLERLAKSLMQRPANVPLRLSEEHRRRQRISTRRKTFIIIAGSAYAIFLFALVGMPTNSAGPRISSLVAATVIGAVGLFGAIMVIGRRIDRIDCIHWMPSAGLCPACGYGIRGVPMESDGCTVCPECGAAWRVPPPEGGDSSSSAKIG